MTRPFAQTALLALLLGALPACYFRTIPMTDVHADEGQRLRGKKVRLEYTAGGQEPRAVTLDVVTVKYPFVDGKPTAMETMRDGDWHLSAEPLASTVSVDLRTVTKAEVFDFNDPRTSSAEPLFLDLDRRVWKKQDVAETLAGPIVGQALTLKLREGERLQVVVMRVTAIDPPYLRGQISSFSQFNYGRWEGVRFKADQPIDTGKITELYEYHQYREQIAEPPSERAAAVASPPRRATALRFVAGALNPSGPLGIDFEYSPSRWFALDVGLGGFPVPDYAAYEASFMARAQVERASRMRLHCGVGVAVGNRFLFGQRAQSTNFEVGTGRAFANGLDLHFSYGLSYMWPTNHSMSRLGFGDVLPYLGIGVGYRFGDDHEASSPDPLPIGLTEPRTKLPGSLPTASFAGSAR